jgi:hypothetical protein
MLDEDQQTAFDLAKDGHNLVVNVQDGCGKTLLIIIKPFIGFY